MTPENERKVEYLKGYQEKRHELKRTRAFINSIRDRELDIAIHYGNGLTGSSGIQRDLSSYIAQMDTEISKYLVERRDCILCCIEIRDQIEKLPTKEQKDIMIYRYIRGYTWEKIAEKMHYSIRWIHRQHGKALFNFQLPNKKCS